MPEPNYIPEHSRALRDISDRSGAGGSIPVIDATDPPGRPTDDRSSAGSRRRLAYKLLALVLLIAATAALMMLW